MAARTLARPFAALAAGGVLTVIGAGGPGALVLGAAAGLPHGGLDNRPARRLLKPGWGRAWPLPFAGLYVGVAGAVLAAWRRAPLATLGAFLVAATLHFGEQDARKADLAAMITHGALPILVPSLCRPGEIVEVFAHVTGRDTQPLVCALAGPAVLLWSACAIRTAARATRAQRGAEIAGEMLAIAMLFATTPPLAAFGCYFALVHAPRALDRMADPGETRARQLRRAAPLTLGGLALGALLWTRSASLPRSTRGIRTMFRLLSALAVPHMILHWVADARRPTRAVKG